MVNYVRRQVVVNVIFKNLHFNSRSHNCLFICYVFGEYYRRVSSREKKTSFKPQLMCGIWIYDSTSYQSSRYNNIHRMYYCMAVCHRNSIRCLYTGPIIILYRHLSLARQGCVRINQMPNKSSKFLISQLVHCSLFCFFMITREMKGERKMDMDRVCLRERHTFFIYEKEKEVVRLVFSLCAWHGNACL